jgi:hypothetical protein
MTAPDRGATYQIALASTGSSTHDAWYPRRASARGRGEPFPLRRPSGREGRIPDLEPQWIRLDMWVLVSNNPKK